MEKIPINDFFGMSPLQRQNVLLEAVLETHAWHFPRNQAYRVTIEAKGLGATITSDDLSRILRPTAHVFKSYFDLMESPFPELDPGVFLKWLSYQLSISLPPEHLAQFKTRYSSLESFLLEIEKIFDDLGFVIGTSSGTSGRATIMVRDADGVSKAIEAYKLAVYRMWGTKDHHQIVFIMPERTRIVMAWVARLATEHLGMATQSHFAIPFPASPDHVRIRSGQLFKPGFSGVIERKLLFPFMNWMNETRVKKIFVNRTINLLEKFSKSRTDILLFGGWSQLDAVYQGLRLRGYGENGLSLVLTSNSMIGTGGGVKEFYPFTPHQIRERLADVLQTPDGEPVPHRDVYGMAEANWAAAQCEYGNYHIPPWVYAVVLDPDDEILNQPDATGMLAFYDPFAGGILFPSFFKTSDRVNLINGGRAYDYNLDCPCGYQTSYITPNSIIRQDRLDEAGCAGQI